MPVDRELIEVVTVANMAGVDAAQKGFLGLSASALALGAVLAAAVVVGKAAIENYKAQTEANNDLANAIKNSTNAQYGSIDAVDAFIAKNAAYIDNQYQAKESVADFIRAGMTEETALKLMGEALDLAALKHISVADAAHVLLLASEGNTKGLRDLGFTASDLKSIIAATGSTMADVTKLTKEAGAADTKLAQAKEALKLEELTLHEKRTVSAKDQEELRLKTLAVTQAEQADAAAHKALTAAQNDQQDSDKRGQAVADTLNGKLQDGRQTTDELAQSQKKLTIEWQNFTSKIGPGLTEVQIKLNEALTTGVDILDLADQALVKLGKDAGNPMWGKLQNFLEFLEAKSVQDAIRNLLDLLNAGGSTAAANLGASGGGYGSGTPRHRAAGGPVGAGEAYTVGEDGPETLVMGSESGTILPNSRGGMYFDLRGAFLLDGPSIDRLANMIAQRVAYAPGT